MLIYPGALKTEGREVNMKIKIKGFDIHTLPPIINASGPGRRGRQWNNWIEVVTGNLYAR